MKYTSKIYAHEILKVIPNKKIEIICRDKNNEFIKKYNLKKADVIEIVTSLNVQSFKEKIENLDPRINAKYLYVFNPLIKLTDAYGSTIDHVYVKICELNNNILVVSIHHNDN